MSAITLLGSARRACAGPTRRETLKAGALTLLGGLFIPPRCSRSKKQPAATCGPPAPKASSSSTCRGARRRKTCTT